MKKILKNNLFSGFLGLILAFSGAVVLGAPSVAAAATPTVAVYSVSNNTVQITVQGDQNQTINLYYYNLNSSVINYAGSIGMTNSSGYFSNTLNSTSYNIPAGASVYVIVNGQQSSTVAWPSVTGGNVYLSQTAATLNQGQSTTVSISGGAGTSNGNGYYVSSNSNSSVVTASVVGNILTINALGGGYSVISICSLSTYAGCASISVTVNGSSYNNGYGNGYVSLSPSSVYVIAGQSQTVSISGYAGYTFGPQYGQNYYISSNSGNQYFTATLSGNIVTVNGIYPGSGTVNVCQYNGSACATLYVTVTAQNSTYNPYYPYNNYPYSNYQNNCAVGSYNYIYGYNGCGVNGYNYGNGYNSYGYPVNGSFYNYTNYTTYPYVTPYTNTGFIRSW